MSNTSTPNDGAMAYIGMGANLGDRLGTLQAAVARLAALGQVQSTSAVYETDPVGYTDQPAFLNAAVSLHTHLAPADLMAKLLRIESELGRVRSFPNAPRTIDLDLLLVDDAVIDTRDLILPHPRLHERPFVLVPLADIAPDVTIPASGTSVSDALERLKPVAGVQRVSGSLKHNPANPE